MLRTAPLLLLLTMLMSTAAAAGDTGHFDLPMQRQDSGAYYVRVGFAGGLSSRLLVDTGSSYVALSAKTFRQIERENGAVFRRTIRGATANGRVLKVRVYSITTLTLGEGCVLSDVEAVLLPGSDRDILGLSALSRLQPFSLQFDPPALSFSACRALAADTLTAAAAPTP